jgi:hypothetical protein
VSALPSREMCPSCSLRVYAMDKQVAVEGYLFHQACFRCHHCKSQLTLLNFAQANGVVFCKPHFKALFLSTWGARRVCPCARAFACACACVGVRLGACCAGTGARVCAGV